MDRELVLALARGRSWVSALRAVEYAELICEVMLEPAGWRLGSPRRFDPEAPLASPSPRPIGWWLEAESVQDRLRRERRSQRT